MVEGDPRGASQTGSRFVDYRNRLRDPFAIEAANIFAKLAIPLRKITPKIDKPETGPESIVIKNAGMRAGDLYYSVILDQEYIDKTVKVCTILGRKIWSGEANIEERKRYNRLMDDLEDARRVDAFRNGAVGPKKTLKFIAEVCEAVPTALLINKEIRDKINHGAKLTVEEMICLGIICCDEVPRFREIAEKRLIVLNGLGRVIFENTGEYFVGPGNGVVSEILRQGWIDGRQPPKIPF